MTPDEFREALGRLHWTQRGLACILETHPTTVRRWAMGQSSIPKPVAEWLWRRAEGMRNDPPPQSELNENSEAA